MVVNNRLGYAFVVSIRLEESLQMNFSCFRMPNVNVILVVCTSPRNHMSL